MSEGHEKSESPNTYWSLDQILESVRELLADLASDGAEGLVLSPLWAREAHNLEWQIRVVQWVIEEWCKDGEEQCWPDVVNRMEKRAREVTEV